jgi:hypothetical protein
MKPIAFLFALSALMPASTASAATIHIEPGADAQERLQGALIEAKPGDTIEIDAGRFELTDGLSLDVDKVVVRGAGAGATILSFKGQKGAGEGLLVTSDDVVLRDFASTATCASNGPAGRRKPTVPMASIRSDRPMS